MRMSDIEYEFTRDIIDKKVTARSARSTRTHNGKRGAVKFPSDYKTKKEIKAMSGKVITYPSLKKPMSWDEFKNLPNDLKKEYITFIRDEFGAPDKYIAEFFGVSTNTLSTYFVDLKLNKGKGSGGAKWKKMCFEDWCKGGRPDVDPNTAIDLKAPEKVTHTRPSGYFAVPTTGAMSFESDVAQALSTINMILGEKRAKLTITWEIIEETE